jgi:uncharacterized membrane protein YeaQ/YmgE (transglycosylase-associated protein family)
LPLPHRSKKENNLARKEPSSERKDPIMSIPISKIIVWLIIGALAGTLAGRLMTFSKRGLGFWANVGFGMVGAVVGGLIFRLLHIDLGLGEIKITFEDLISAFVGSLLCIIAWRLIRRNAEPKKQQKSGS